VAYRGDREYGTIVEVTSHLLGSELTVVARPVPRRCHWMMRWTSPLTAERCSWS
jgi:hypothetical protein